MEKASPHLHICQYAQVTNKYNTMYVNVKDILILSKIINFHTNIISQDKTYLELQILKLLASIYQAMCDLLYWSKALDNDCIETGNAGPICNASITKEMD